MKFHLSHHSTLQFALPVILETLASTFINLVFSSLIGGISGSSLTVISQCNMIVNLFVAVFAMFTTGSSVLCARLLGAGERREASQVVEQTILLGAVFSGVITLLCILFTQPIIRLLMPNAETFVLQEAYSHFRVLILSLPFLAITNILAVVLRASRDSRTAMLINLTTCLLQLGFAFLFLRVLSMGLAGAGLTYLCCRICSMAMAFAALLLSHRYLLKLRHILKPHFATIRRIFAIGLPAAIEQSLVQAGYLLCGSMAIGLGTFEAAVYNVANTLYTFAALPQGIFTAIALTVTGQLIGAKEYEKAKKTGWRLWRLSLLSIFVLSAVLFLLRHQLTPLYSPDPAVQTAAAAAIVAALFMNPAGTSLNTLNPQLSAGGDTKSVMYTSLVGVWLVRIPLTWLLCYHWHLGASGVFIANAISLYVRMILNLFRFIGGKYLYMRV